MATGLMQDFTGKTPLISVGVISAVFRGGTPGETAESMIQTVKKAATPTG